MGARGPSPKPTALRVLEGNPSHRPLPVGEPKPTGVPALPAWLDDEARSCWQRVVETMTAVPGWVSSADWLVLEGLARYYSLWRECQKDIAENGLTYEAMVLLDAQGKPLSADAAQIVRRARPQVKIGREAWVEVMKCADRLGLSPGQRSRILLKPPEDAKDDDLDPS